MKQKLQLKGLSQEELTIKVDELRRKLFSLRLNASTSPVKDHASYKKLRRNIARALTYMREHTMKVN